MVDLIAVSHPGKHGDALYALPAAKRLSEVMGMKVDFYSSDYCLPLKPLIEFQSYINAFYVAPNYKIERMDMGCQPYYVPIDRYVYKRVDHLGFRRVPDQAIHRFIAAEAGIGDVADPTYEVPEWYNPPYKDYLVLATRGDTTYKGLFQDIIDQSPLPVMLIGGAGEHKFFSTSGKKVIVRTGEDYLMTAAMIAKSRGFIGIMSSQLVLANGFNIPKVIPHNGRSWDMRHVIYSENHHYMVEPTVEEVLGVFDGIL